MTEILYKLRAEHDDFAKVLDVLGQEVKSYKQDGRLNRNVIEDVVDYCQDFATLCHHPKEDLIYRKLRLTTDCAVLQKVGDLLAGREALLALTDELAATVDNLRSDTAEDRARFVWMAQVFLKRCRNRIKAEVDELFPLAVRCLSDQDWAEIERDAVALEALHLADANDERFAALSRLISAHESLCQRLSCRDTW